MNEIKLIKDAFGFLQKNGFSLECTKSNMEYGLIYSCATVNIILDYDLRLHRFDVGISNPKQTTYIPLLEANIRSELYRKDFLQKINAVYIDAKNDWTITETHFRTIVELYAEFTRENLKEIITIFN